MGKGPSSQGCGSQGEFQWAYRNSIYIRPACSTTFKVSGTTPLPPLPRRAQVCRAGVPAALFERSEFSGRPGRRAGGRGAEGQGSGARSLSPFLTRIRKGVARRGELPARRLRQRLAPPKRAPKRPKSQTAPQAASSGVPNPCPATTRMKRRTQTMPPVHPKIQGRAPG